MSALNECNLTPFKRNFSTESQLKYEIMGWFALAFNFICYFVFLCFRPYYIHLRNRSAIIPFIMFVGICMIVISSCFRISRKREIFPCRSLVLLNYLPFLFCGGAYIAQIYVYKYKVNMNKTGKKLGACEKFVKFMTMQNSEISRDVVPYHSESSKQNQTRFSTEFFLPLIFCLITGIPVILVILIRILTDDTLNSNCLGCDLILLDYGCMIIGGIFIIVAIVYGIYFTRNDSDPLSIRREAFLMMLGGAAFSFPSWGLRILDPWQLESNGIMMWQILQVVGGTCSLYVMTILQVIIAFHQRRKPINVAITLRGILDNEEVYRLFLQHSEQELSSENILFVKDVEEWRRVFLVSPVQTQIITANRIVQQYVSNDSFTPINISSVDQRNVMDALRLNNITINLFDSCYNECVKNIMRDSIPRWTRSKDFKKDMIDSELIRLTNAS